ncbi:MAG: hypothetical protein PHP28_11635 [Actinomycetota bacterium]|nr:hypothetical protein [Actinomycetota bacterium]MDD5666425.1 hypothetical protein [Actinomycetota bacterium]
MKNREPRLKTGFNYRDSQISPKVKRGGLEDREAGGVSGEKTSKAARNLGVRAGIEV